MSVNVGNLAIVSGTDTKFGEVPSQGMKAILIGNESGLTVTISMQGGGVQKTLYPGTVDWFAVKQGFNGNILIHPVTLLNNLSSWPASSLIFDAIGLNDPEEASMYPLSLNRNTNIGNSVATVGGSTLNIINDNNAAGTQIVEATVTGDGSSAVSLKNDGTLVLGNATHKGSISSDNAKFITDGSGNVTEQNATVQGNETVAGTLSVTGASTLTGDVTMLGKLLANIAAGGTINGDVSGTATIYYPIWGSALKVFIVIFNNYKSASTGQFVFPSTCSNGILLLGRFASGVGSVQFMNGVAIQQVRSITTLGGSPAGTAGAGVAQNTAVSESYSLLPGSTSDRLQVNASNSSTSFNTVLFIGQ